MCVERVCQTSLILIVKTIISFLRLKDTLTSSSQLIADTGTETLLLIASMSSLGQESQRLKVYALSRDVDHGDGVKEYGPLGNVSQGQDKELQGLRSRRFGWQLASIASDGSSEIGGNDETKRQAVSATT